MKLAMDDGNASEADPLESLWRAAGSGDRAASAELLRRVSPLIYKLARGMLGFHCADVEDVCQRALMELLRALPRFRGECKISHFAARIAQKVIRQHRRGTSRSRNREMEVSLTREELVTDASELGRRERSRIWQRLLDDLPDEQAETIALRVLLDYSLEETATTMGVPVNTVRSRIRLAREALRRRIDADPETLELLRGGT